MSKESGCQKRPFPRNARQGPQCPVCGGETLLASERPETFECLDCGRVIDPPAEGMRFGTQNGDGNGNGNHVS